MSSRRLRDDEDDVDFDEPDMDPPGTTRNCILILIVIGLSLVAIGLVAGLGGATLNRLEGGLDRIKHVKDTLVEICTKILDLGDHLDQQHREILEAIEERNCEIVGVQTGDGCIFSSQDILTARELAVGYLRKTTALFAFFGTFSAEWIHSEFPKLEYAKTPAEQAAYPHLQEARAALQAIDDAIANPATTDAEKYSMSVSRLQIERDVRLLELNFYQSAYGDIDWFWEVDIQNVDFLGPLLFPASAGGPEYDDKIIELVNNLEQAYIDRRVFMLDVLAKDSPPHVCPNVTCHSLSGEFATISSPGWRDPLCDAIGDAGKKAACFAQLPNIQAALDLYAPVVLGPYCDAAATWRPDNSPGLVNVHNGNETYAAWLKFHTGTTLTPPEIVAVGVAAETEIVNAIELLTGDTFATYANEKADLTNPKYTVCFDTEEETRAYYASQLDVIGEQIYTAEHGYGSRTILYNSRAAFCCGMDFGAYDIQKGIWITPGRFFWDYTGTNGSQSCISRYNSGLMIHEVHGGHGTQMIANEAYCPFDPLLAFFAGFWEGHAHYAELACLTTNICDDPLEAAAGFYGDRILRAVRLRVDPEMHAYGGDPADCVAKYLSIGIKIGFATSECTVRYPQWPGQATAYRIPADFFQQQRELVEAALGGDFDPKEFNLLILKFSQATLDQIALLVQTYIVWAQDRNAAVGMPLFELIDQQLWRNAAAVLSAGWESSESGAVLSSSVSSAKDRLEKINAAMAALPANVATMLATHPRFSRPGGLRL